MRVLLTGASGFLGSHCARELIQSGHSVTALLRSTSSREALRDLPLHIYQAQIPQEQTLGDALEVDAVIHVAGAVKALHNEDFFRVNEQGTAYLVREILKRPHPPRLFLHISTIAVLDPSRDGSDFCRPAISCHPLSAYGQSKQAAELALEPLKGRMRVLILRPPVLYGPGDRELLPLFQSVSAGLLPVYRRGEQLLSLCYVEDVARAIGQMLENEGTDDGTYCLDSGEVQTWLSLAESLEQVLGRKARILRVPDPLFAAAACFTQIISRIRRRPSAFSPDKMKDLRQAAWVCGYQKLHERFAWKPKVLFKEGAKRTLRAYLESGWIKTRSGTAQA